MNPKIQSYLSTVLIVASAGIQFLLLSGTINADQIGVTHQDAARVMLILGFLQVCLTALQSRLASPDQAAQITKQDQLINQGNDTIARYEGVINQHVVTIARQAEALTIHAREAHDGGAPPPPHAVGHVPDSIRSK